MKTLLADLKIGPIPGFLLKSKATHLAAMKLVAAGKARWVKRHKLSQPSLVAES